MADLTQILNECQRTFSVHPDNISKIRREYESSVPFLEELFRYLKRLFLLDNISSLTPLKRVLKFIARIGTYPASQTGSKDWADSYLSGLIHFCLKFTKSSKKSARLRSLELISIILKDFPDDFSLNESVYDSIQQEVYPLLSDIASTVRCQAIVSLSRLQDPTDPENRIIKKITKMMETDSNRNVRETCLRNVGIVKTTLPAIFSRIRDSSEFVRKTAFSVIKEKLDLRSISIYNRNAILRSGLRDRSSLVRKECLDMVLRYWLASCEDIIEFLKLFDIEENESDATILMENLINSNIDFGEPFSPPFSDDLSSEKAFLWKTCCCEIEKKKPIDWSKMDAIMIDPPKFLELLEQNLDKKFIFKQLLYLCKHLNLLNENHREMVIDKTQQLLLNLKISNEFVSNISDITRSIFSSEQSHSKYLMQAILKLLEINETNNHSADLNSEKIKQLETQVYTRILSVIKDMLRFSKLGLELPDIKFIKEKLILPSVIKDNPFIRAPAIEALALYCYFDADEARKYVVLLYHVLKNDQEALQLIALKSIVDLLLIHNDLVNLNIAPFKDTSATNEETIVDAISTSLGSDDELMMYTAVEGFSKLLTLGRISSVKPMSMCILLLFNPNSSDEEPVQQCLSLFFSSFLYLKNKNFGNNAEIFSKAFLPTIKIILHAPSSSPLSKISIDTFVEWVFAFFPDSDDPISFPDLSMKEAFIRNETVIAKIRCDLITSLLKEIKSNLESEEGLRMCKVLLKIKINRNLNEKATSLAKNALVTAEKSTCDKFIKFSLKRFLRSIETINK